MLYGFYDGAMIFLEPMVAKLLLDTKPDLTMAIPVEARVAFLWQRTAPIRFSTASYLASDWSTLDFEASRLALPYHALAPLVINGSGRTCVDLSGPGCDVPLMA